MHTIKFYPKVLTFVLFVFLVWVASYDLAGGWGKKPETAVERTMDQAGELIEQTVMKITPADAYSVGIGTARAEHPGELKRKARDSAFLDAYAKLGALVDGIYLEGGETLKLGKSHNQELVATVDAIIKGSQTALEVWVPAQDLYYVVLVIPSVASTLKKQAKIDIRWASEVNEKTALSEMGSGYSKDNPFTALSLIKARESAYIDAYRKLLDASKGAVIKMIAKTEFELKEKQIMAFISGKLNSARVTGENWEGDCGQKSYCVDLLMYQEEIADAAVLAGVPREAIKTTN